MMYGFEVCEIPSILKIIYFLKILINVVKFLVPIGLIIMVSLDLGKGVINGEKKFGEILKASSNRILAAMIIFLLPTIVDFSLGFVSNLIGYESCWTNANLSFIEEQQKLWDDAVKKSREEKNHDKDQFEAAFPGIITEAGPFEIVKIDTTDLGCPLYYNPANNQTSPFLYIRKSAAVFLHTALKGACSFANSVDYMPYLQTAGAFVNREDAGNDYHAKGLAIDLNNLWSYTENGKKYYPYSSQGSGTWNKYQDFICEVCDGKEACDKNVNYVIYEKYFKSSGWCWGGNWGPEWFDPMHFEKTANGCSTKNKKEIMCD